MSSALFKNNATVSCVLRAQGVNRYGFEQRGAVPGLSEFRIYLERGTVRVTGINGVTSTADGTAMVARRFDLQEGDLLEMKDGSKWIIFSESEALDVVNAKAIHRIYNLTKQRKSD